MSDFTAIPIFAETLTPFHYFSVPIQSGAATIPDYIGDKAISFAIGSALGCLCSSPALQEKSNYRKDMANLPCLASIFETPEPGLMKPLGCRLNIDSELGFSKKIKDATGTGNLKTWFYIQEVPPQKVFKGVLFGDDPFKIAGTENEQLIVRIGRHRSGIVSLTKDTKGEIEKVQLNAHTATVFGKKIEDAGIKMKKYAMHDMQISEYLPLDRAKQEVARWLEH